MKRLNIVLLLSLIVVFGLLIRIVFFTKVISSDDLGYYNLAYKITQNIFKPDVSFHSPRIGLTYTTAFFYKLFGINEITSNLLPLLTSVFSVTLIFYIGKIMFNEKIGLISAFLLSFFPLNVFYSTTLFPDLPSGFFIALSVFLFLKAEKNNLNLDYLFAGLSVGIAYLMKELSVLIFGFFVLHILYKKNLKKEHFLILAGFLLIFGVELSYYAMKNLNPFFRYTIVSAQGTNIMKTYYPNYFGVKVFSRLFLHYPYLIFTNWLTNLFYIFIVISAVYCILKKKKESYILFMWILPLAIYVNFGSLNFSEYIPLPADVRYIEIITIPSILLVAYFLYQNKKLLNGLFTPSIIIFLLFTSVYFIATNKQRQNSENLYQASLFFKSAPKKIIYTDPRSAETLNYLFNFQKDYVLSSFNKPDSMSFNGDKNNLADFKNIHDAYVVVNWKMINALLENSKDMTFPPKITEQQKNWKEKFSYGEGKDKLIIYYVS